MLLKEFVSKFTDIGILDRINIVYNASFTMYDIASACWRRELKDMLDTYGNDVIVQFILSNSQEELGMTIEVKNKEDYKNDLFKQE